MNGIDRILSAIGVKNLIELLASQGLTWADLHTLLLHVFEQRMGNVTPAEILKNHKANRFTTASEADPRELTKIDTLLYDLLPGSFVPIELSPVNAVGANSVLASLDPKVVLSTIRNVEVVGDPSMALTIECAHRRLVLARIKSEQQTHLASSHRVLRLQDFPKESSLTAHFRAFALASAARDTAGLNKFELDSLSTHLQLWLEFASQCSKIEYHADNIGVVISDVRIVESLIRDGRANNDEVMKRAKDASFHLFQACGVNLPGQIEYARQIPINDLKLETCIRELQFAERQIVDPLRAKYPSVRFSFDLERCSGKGYYSGLCYRLSAENSSGARHSIAGGGACNWTAKLLQNRKEDLITSGFGTEMFQRLFKRP